MARYATALLKINYPEHNGRPNPKHGKIHVVGSVPITCMEADLTTKKYYDTEADALAACSAGGATDIQRLDCSWYMRDGKLV